MLIIKLKRPQTSYFVSTANIQFFAKLSNQNRDFQQTGGMVLTLLGPIFFWFLIDKLKFYKKVVQKRGDIGLDKVVMMEKEKKEEKDGLP